MPKVSNRSTAHKSRRRTSSSSIYQVRNWAAYGQSLKQRGNVTVWFSPEAVSARITPVMVTMVPMRK